MDSMPTASVRRQPFRDERGHGAIVFDPTRLPQATPALFEPEGFGADARPVQGQGGRGAAWFVRGEFGEAVLRRYRRGGWMARLSADRYAWQGEANVRSLREFALLRRLRDRGLPVPAPIAAMYRRRGLGYGAALLVERIPHVRSFADLVVERGGRAPWDAVGAAIAHCHKQGAHHADLNAHNVLVAAGDVVWLIDWDKGRIEAGTGAWCARVLGRLERSLRKRCAAVPADDLASGMRRLRAAYDRELGA